jgi:hypothetical protein
LPDLRDLNSVIAPKAIIIRLAGSGTIVLSAHIFTDASVDSPNRFSPHGPATKKFEPVEGS